MDFTNIKNKGTALVRKLHNKGFFAMTFANVIAKIIGFCGGMLLVRVFSKSDYGIYASVINTLGFLLLFGDLGTSISAVQYGSENHNNPIKRDAYLTWGYMIGMAFSVLMGILILFSPMFFPYSLVEAIPLTVMLFFYPVLNTTNLFLEVNLRIHLKNNKFAAYRFLNSFIFYLFLIPFAMWMGLPGSMLAKYCIAIILIIVGIYLNRDIMQFRSPKKHLNPSERKGFLKFAVASQLYSTLDYTLMLMDVFIISLMYADPNIIASYKVATIIPSAVVFIPTSVMMFLIPYFARNKDDMKWVKSKFNKTVIMGIGLYGAITIIAITTSGFIVPFIFGADYVDAIACYNVLMVGFFFTATFRLPANDVIYTQRKIRVNIIITVICGAVNIVLDVLLIKLYGSIGAAIATSTVMITGAVLGYLYMRYYINKRTKELDIQNDSLTKL